MTVYYVEHKGSKDTIQAAYAFIHKHISDFVACASDDLLSRYQYIIFRDEEGHCKFVKEIRDNYIKLDCKGRRPL